MRVRIVFLVLCLSFSSWTQVFHVSDTSALIIKTVNQSPAHWYVEVFSDVSVDTTLRWKAAHFDNIPSEWEIVFDDQTNSYSNVEVGDSADFDFPANQSFAKKLIIGAILNGTPGHGICYFDVYDPNNPSFVQTISYEFIVTNSTNGIGDWSEDSFLKLQDGFLKVKDGSDARFEVFDASGSLFLKMELTNQLNLISLPKNQLLVIHVMLQDKEAIIKIYN